MFYIIALGIVFLIVLLLVSNERSYKNGYNDALKRTGTIYGKDAERFRQQMENPKPISTEERDRIHRAAELLKSILKT